MTLTLTDIAQLQLRTSAQADDVNETLRKHLGMRHRYGPARLAIARSLGLPEPPPVEQTKGSEPGKTIRGDPLFGSGAEVAAWAALIVEHAGKELDRAELQNLVAAHWHRGALLLAREWEETGSDYARFVALLCERAGLRLGGDDAKGGRERQPDDPSTDVPARPVLLRLGDPGTDLLTGEPVTWAINAPGRSPHIAAMGTLGTGKTRIAMMLLRQLRDQSGCAVIAFDFKGDLSENPAIADSLGATIVRPPREPAPLDVLQVVAGDEQGVDVAALRFRESFVRVCASKPGAKQQSALAEAARRALGRVKATRLEDIQAELLALYEEGQIKEDTITATFDDLCRFRLFEPELAHDAFFRRSWIIDVHDAPESAQRLVAFLLFDALDTWFKQLRDAELDSQNNRGLRTVLLIDEARRILGYGQPSLIEIVRMSRSKGGAVMLVSQSPDDFMQEDEDFLANIGLLFSFRTNAKPGSLQRVFGERIDLAGLADGVCVTRIPDAGRKRPVKVQAWK
jgi:DNA sulfur modification protein DndE